MEPHSRFKPSVDDVLNELPKKLGHANPPGVHIYFWDQDQDIPAHICC